MAKYLIFPSEVSPEVSRFDRFASWASSLVSKSAFFVFSLLLIGLWLPSYFLIQDVNTWQLIINTATTCLTFLMVSLLENTQKRDNLATHHKLNAIADALANFIDVYQTQLPDYDAMLALKLQRDLAELRASIGVENRESS